MPRRSANKLKMAGITKGIVRPEPFKLEWKIERFFTDCNKLGDCYKSSMCSIPYIDKMTHWYLEVYPKGIEEYQDCTSLYVYFKCKENMKLTVDIRFELVNQQGAIVVKEDKELYTFEGPLDNFGWGDFIEQDFIKDTGNGVLFDDTLTIAFEIKFQKANQEVIQKFCGYDELLARIGEGFTEYEELLESSNYTDVTFTVQDKKINGHKAILSFKSPVLKAFFRDDMEKRKVIDVTDIDYDVIKELFRFIYSKKVRNIDQMASKLLIAADRYQVNELKALCEKALYEKLTVDNAIDYLELTKACDTIHLKRLVIQFIGDHLKDVIKKPGFADLTNNLMYEIMQAIAK